MTGRALIESKRHGAKCAMVTMCVATVMSAAGLFEIASLPTLPVGR